MCVGGWVGGCACMCVCVCVCVVVCVRVCVCVVEKGCVQFTIHNINTVWVYTLLYYALTKFAQLSVSHLEALKV